MIDFWGVAGLLSMFLIGRGLMALTWSMTGGRHGRRHRRAVKK